MLGVVAPVCAQHYAGVDFLREFVDKARNKLNVEFRENVSQNKIKIQRRDGKENVA